VSIATRALRREAKGRSVMAALAFALGLAITMQVVFSDLDPIGAVALGAVLASMALAAWRPALGALVLLALFSDVLYFGTYGVSLPVGQLVPADVLLVGWWTLTVLAVLWHPEGILIPSSLTRCVTVLYPALLAFYFVYTSLSFGPGLSEMLRSARPFLYLTLFVPLAFWLRAAGAIEELMRVALIAALCAVALQLLIYTAGVDVTPFGLFYEWQVWRHAFEGFDRSNQPFFGLNLILAGGCLTLALRKGPRLARLGWAACVGALLISALISFGRGFWAGMLVACATAVAIESRRRRSLSAPALAAAGIVVFLALGAMAGLAGIDLSALGGAVVDRGALGASSIRYLEGTLGDRYDNINRALIQEHPLLGIGFYLGLGTAADIDLADTGHNLYADLMLRMGVVGLLFFTAMLLVFLNRCRLALSFDLPWHHRAAVVGCLGAALGNSVWGISSSHIIYRRGMLELALIMAVVEILIHLAEQRSGDPRRPAAAEPA
jgi:hypothetical protein